MKSKKPYRHMTTCFLTFNVITPAPAKQLLRKPSRLGSHPVLMLIFKDYDYCMSIPTEVGFIAAYVGPLATELYRLDETWVSACKAQVWVAPVRVTVKKSLDTYTSPYYAILSHEIRALAHRTTFLMRLCWSRKKICCVNCIEICGVRVKRRSKRMGCAYYK